MKFHDFMTINQASRKFGMDLKPEENLRLAKQMVYESDASEQSVFAYRHAQSELLWHRQHRPYYNIWPAIVPLINAVKLSLPTSSVTIPAALLLRMPEKDNPLTVSGKPVRTVLMTRQTVNTQPGGGKQVDGLVAMYDFGETAYSLPLFSFVIFPFLENKSVEFSLKVLPPYPEGFYEGVKTTDSEVQAIVRLCICVALLGNGSELVTPDILAKDRPRYEMASEEEKIVIEERARRRGKNGFDVGRCLSGRTIAPHYRNGHLALVWFGKGKQQCRIQWRRGSLVNRKKISEVPTGYVQ